MVLLSYTIQVRAKLQEVWEYFSKFENIKEWDPNVRKATVRNSPPELLGTTYDLVTVFKGNESEIVYTLVEYEPKRRITVKGKNSMITAIDDISFREVNEGITEIHYEAEISLNHILCCCTCFIRKDLERLAELTEQGMKERCRELYGKNCV